MDRVALEKLETEYLAVVPIAERLGVCIQDQVGILLSKNAVSLGVPMEHRVKTWLSLSEKIDRKLLQIASIKEIADLVGLRTILLFKRDISRVCELIERTFVVVSKEDTGERLTDTQFGYTSLHYSIVLPDSWYSVPTFCDFSGLQVEIQIRTLAQHIWAAASHKLQYKSEKNVPAPIRRTIYRVSALLETVDLEFERVLSEREQYVGSLDKQRPEETLNVDMLTAILTELLPTAHRDLDEPEPYADLMDNLVELGVTTAAGVRSLVAKNIDYALRRDKELVEEVVSGKVQAPESMDRIARGVFCTHVGLTRLMLANEFGDVAKEILTRPRKKG
jgi:putative GTP pyrophosphokinase